MIYFGWSYFFKGKEVKDLKLIHSLIDGIKGIQWQ